MVTSATHLALIAAALAICGFLLYRLVLPKPIAGIPYNKHSARRLLGDLPDAFTWHRERKELFTWLTAQTVKLNSPIVQVFMRPLGRPCKSFAMTLGSHTKNQPRVAAHEIQGSSFRISEKRRISWYAVHASSIARTSLETW